MFEAIYFGKISKEETERLLEIHGKDGSFLVRDSESVPGAYCLCVRQGLFVCTYRIMRSSGKWGILTSPITVPKLFKTLDLLIETYRRSPPSSMAPLYHPLKKSSVCEHLRDEGLQYLEMC
ncbi:SH2 domain-containing protein 1A-like [Polypterus senegalus]|uniref:SH2 domain-containing protein 1A-like n=1 Tax=Polypterus senegalus TaxID=55291 RepID=UPI00196277AE|nr:SH2 domain-containing protein 1A-like [Polypterus senegalus]